MSNANTPENDPRYHSMNMRRRFLRSAGVAGAGMLVTGGAPRALLSRGVLGIAEPEKEVTANEDLMREHGVLKRALLIYRDGIRRLDGSDDLPSAVLADTAQLIRRFVEEYHEKQEERYIFPRFEKAGEHTELVRTLRLQHERGRQRTAAILHLANDTALKNAESRATIAGHMKAFIRMYEPHEAREDTVLFPAFHELVSSNEYDSIGEEMERNERRTFGGDGFDMAVDKVAELEKKLGIYDLAQFTPAALGPART